MDSHDGWFGPTDQMLYYLSTVNADRDAEGNYLITGVPVIAGLDPSDCVVPAGAQYLVNGKPCNLAAGLRSTSYGIAAKVF